MIEIQDLVSTGEMRRREDYYDGSSLRVSTVGETRGYQMVGGDDDGEPIEFRAHRGSRKASVYREVVIGERQFGELQALGRQHGAHLLAELDPYGDHVDRCGGGGASDGAACFGATG